MPATLSQSQRIFELLRESGMRRVTLLVVPDTGWDDRSLDALRGMVSAGAELAGHGWRHRVTDIRGLKHRLHSLLVSRDVAEHLALDRDGAIALMRRCYDWFAEHGLPVPQLYVPPAWAMGGVPRAALDRLPFDYFETTAGVYDSRAGRFIALPMLGYQADTAFRATAIRAWNRLNLSLAGPNRPLRLGIHPEDLDLRLGEALRRQLAVGGRAISYGGLVSG